MHSKYEHINPLLAAYASYSLRDIYLSTGEYDKASLLKHNSFILNN